MKDNKFKTFDSLKPFASSLWWIWFLSGKKGDLPENILLKITIHISVIGNNKIIIGKWGAKAWDEFKLAVIDNDASVNPIK